MTDPANIRSSRIGANFFRGCVDKTLRGRCRLPPLHPPTPEYNAFTQHAHVHTHNDPLAFVITVQSVSIVCPKPVFLFFLAVPENRTRPQLRREALLPLHHRRRYRRRCRRRRRVTITASNRPGKDVHYQLIREVRPRVMK